MTRHARIEVFPEKVRVGSVENLTGSASYVGPADGPTPHGAVDQPTGQWYWRLVGGNGETVCVSEAFTRKASAKRSAKRACLTMFEVTGWAWPNWDDVIREVHS